MSDIAPEKSGWRRKLSTCGVRDYRKRSGVAHTEQKKPPEGGRSPHSGLFDLGFLERNVLADDRIVLPEFKLVGRLSRVFLGHVIVSGVRGAHELDLDRPGLGHGAFRFGSLLARRQEHIGVARAVKPSRRYVAERRPSKPAHRRSARVLRGEAEERFISGFQL